MADAQYVDLNQYTVSQLKAIARHLNIPGRSTVIRKADLVELIDQFAQTQQFLAIPTAYDNLTRRDLINLARQLGIPRTSIMRKQDLIDAIIENSP